jgi:hypothetical protein
MPPRTMPPVDLDEAIFWRPPGAPAAEPDNTRQNQLRGDQSRRLPSLSEPNGPTAPILPPLDTDCSPGIRSLENSNADFVVISDDSETNSDDDDGSKAASDFDDSQDFFPSIYLR